MCRTGEGKDKLVIAGCVFCTEVEDTRMGAISKMARRGLLQPYGLRNDARAAHTAARTRQGGGNPLPDTPPPEVSDSEGSEGRGTGEQRSKWGQHHPKPVEPEPDVREVPVADGAAHEVFIVAERAAPQHPGIVPS